MKKVYTILTALMLTIAAMGQTLNITSGGTTTSYSASQLTESNPITFTGGSVMTVNSTSYTISDITQAWISTTSSTADANTVNIVYNGSSATVTAADNVAPYVSASVSGGHVTITQSNTDAVDGDEITYVLSGSTTDGSFTLGGSYKCTVSLAGLTLTNPSGAAINITNSKRIQLSAKSGTTNTLTDGSGSQKACIYSKGQLQLQGNGTLNVVGNYKHGIKSASYIEIKNLTLNITSTVGDGINCEEYLQMKSGTVTITGVGDDGIQCDLGGTTSTGQTADHEDEDSGNIYIEGGTLNVTTTAAATKCIKSEGDIVISDGYITASTSGIGAWDTDDSEVKGSTCLNADGAMTISGGTLVLTNTGSGGKGMKCDGAMTVSGGTITVTTSGGIYYQNGSSGTANTNYTGNTDNVNDSYYTTPKAIKSTGALTISGGTVYAKSGKHEGIESKSTLTVTGGYVYSEASDDAMNASGDFTISGGYVFGNSSGNDGLDANGNFYIKGGNVVAVAAGGAECGIDANTEGGKQLYITGGNVVAIGGFEKGASISGGTAKQASSFSKGTWYGLYNGSTLAFAFKVPSNSTMGSPMAVYTTGTPALQSSVTGSGDSFWNGYGYAACSGGSTVSLSTYSSGGNGGGPGGGGGRGW